MLSFKIETETVSVFVGKKEDRSLVSSGAGVLLVYLLKGREFESMRVVGVTAH